MKTILVIDDDPAVLELLNVRLRGTYHTVTLANPAEALTTAERHCHDLVLCDMDMPKVNGAEVAAALRKGGSSVPVVFLTGLLTPSEARDVPGAGGKRVLAKQAPVGEILACIRSEIGE